MGAVAGYLEGLNLTSIIIRVLLSMVCGGAIGVERGRAHQAAGMRTYMLVCMGAAMVMMTGQYMYIHFQTGDPARLGAQVVSGIGFLGAGTILVTRQNQGRQYYHSGEDKDPGIDHSGRIVDFGMYRP